MAESLVYRLVKNVELNRRALIANAQSKGKIIDNTASLTQAVAVNNTIEPSASPEKIEVRFFDADGTLLQQSYIDYGGSVTPPANPNYDSERLTFKRWASAIGERFDNITHDVDYGALYTINDGAYHLFCTFNDTTGYTVTLPINQTRSNTITINWGDGTENDTKTNTGTTNISHTFAQAGDYEIIISSDTKIDSSYAYYLDSYVLSTSSSSNIIDALINAYMPIVAGSNFQYSEGLQTVVNEYYYARSSNNIHKVKNIIISESYSNYSGRVIIFCYNTKMCIIDKDFNIDVSFQSFYGGIDKLIIPENINMTSCINTYCLDKLIILSPTCPSFNSIYSLKSLLLLNPATPSLSEISYAYSLENYIYPNSINLITGTFAEYSHIKQVVIPQDCTIQNGLLNDMYYLQSLVLPQNFNQSLTIDSYQITIPSIIDMLNKVQDSTGGTAQTLTFSQDNIQIQLLNTFVVLDNGIWVQATRTTPNAMTLVEAFNSKNWTIS